MTTSPPILGVDPAMTGAAVLLHPGGFRVLAAWKWKERARGGAKVWEIVGCHEVDDGGRYRVMTRRTVAPFGVLGEVIREDARVVLHGKPYALAGENAVVGRNVATSVIVARNAGRVLGPLETLAVGAASEWVRASEWRSLILGLGTATPREEAKRESRGKMPIKIPSLLEVAALLGGGDDLTDAAGVAAWLAVQLSRPPSSDPRPKPSARKRKPSSRRG